jgi:hypothetical protein
MSNFPPLDKDPEKNLTKEHECLFLPSRIPFTAENALLFCYRDNNISVLNRITFSIIQVSWLRQAPSVTPVNTTWFTTVPYESIVTNYVWNRKQLTHTGWSCHTSGERFLRYIDTTKHTDTQSWLRRSRHEKTAVFLRFHVLYLFNMMCYPYTAQVSPWTDSQVKLYAGQRTTWNPKDDFCENSTSFCSLITILNHSNVRC